MPLAKPDVPCNTLRMMNPLLVLALVLSLGLFPAATKVSAAAAPAKKPTPNLQPNPRKLNPPPGVIVPAAVKAELAAEVELLGKEIEHARGQLHCRRRSAVRGD